MIITLKNVKYHYEGKKIQLQRLKLLRLKKTSEGYIV